MVHAEQLAAPSAEYAPAAHDVQLFDSLPANVPAAHDVQVPCDPLENFPLEQAVHAELLLLAKFSFALPTGHPMQ